MLKSFAAEQTKFQDEINALFDRHSWRLWIVLFFAYLGCFHLALDLVHYLRPAWQIPHYEEYFTTFLTSGSIVYVHRFRRRTTPEQREAEKQVLEQADAILREAQAHAGGAPL